MSPICRNPLAFPHQRSALFLLLAISFLLLFATPIRASSHHHNHHHHQNRRSSHQNALEGENDNAASESSSQSSIILEDNNGNGGELTATEVAQESGPENGSNNVEEEPTTEIGGSSPGKALFREYLDRGLYTCSTKYFGILRKLNKLIATAHSEYTHCQRMAEKADRSGQSAAESRKLAAQLEMINELLND